MAPPTMEIPDDAEHASFARDFIRHYRLLKMILLDPPRHPPRSSTMGLEEILHATPPGVVEDNYPIFELEDAIAVYADGTVANLLAQNRDRKIYIQGRVVRDDGDEEDDGNGSWFIKYDDPQNPGMTKDRSGEYIREEFGGQVSHSHDQIKLWVNLQQKWFELKPAAEYLHTFQIMYNVVGIFWTNVQLVEKRDSSANNQTDLLHLVGKYQMIEKGSSLTVRQLLENIDECGDFLRTECLAYDGVRLDKSSLFLWLQATDKTQENTKNLAVKLCDLVRNMDFDAAPPPPLVNGPVTTAANKIHGYYKSTAYPNGYQRFSTIGRLVNILAMHALEHREPRVRPEDISLAKIAHYLEREFNIQFRDPCVAFLQYKRVEILRDLHADLHKTKLHAELQKDPGPNFPKFLGASKAAQRSVYDKLISGKLKIVRRGYIEGIDEASDGLGGAKYEDMATGKTVADYPHLAGAFSRSTSIDSRLRLGQEPGMNSENGPVRVGVPVHKHLEDVTSYGDHNLINPVAEARYGGRVQKENGRRHGGYGGSLY